MAWNYFESVAQVVFRHFNSLVCSKIEKLKFFAVDIRFFGIFAGYVASLSDLFFGALRFKIGLTLLVCLTAIRGLLRKFARGG